MKILLVILDGASDRPFPFPQTPLQAASKPFLDGVASSGICGIMDPISPGIPPGSAPAHLALFGYDPYEFYTGRGPFEAAGTGLDVKEGDIAFRCNFASMKNGVIVDRRAGRIRETSELEKAINEEIDLGVEFHFRAGTSHRGALLLRGDGLSAELTGTDPHREGVPPNSARALKREGKLTAKIVNEFVSKAEKILGDHPVNKKREKEGKHPANILLLRGPGKVPPIPPFPEKWKLRTAAVCAASLIIGIARICRMDFLPTQGVTGGIDSPIERKIENVNLALKKYDFVVLNIKGADEASHDGKWDDKKKFLEKVDSALSELSRADILVITADHSSPVSLRDHSGDPVPVVISGGGVRRDNVRRYDEISCAEGGLGRIRAINLLPLLLDLAGKGEKFGE